MNSTGLKYRDQSVTVSVIMPTYQREEAIGRAAASVLAQRGIGKAAIELVIVDDGSSDNTEAVVKALTVPPPHRIVYEKVEHIGQPGLVRNHGLKRSTGEYIGYCDSDDIWLPHHLATCLRQFELYPDCVMVETWWSFQVREKSLHRWKIEYQPASTDGRTTTTNSRLHRRDVIKQAGLFGELRWGEDIDLWTRIGFIGPIRRVKIPTTAHAYTKGGDNLTYEFCPDISRAYDGTGAAAAPAPPAAPAPQDAPTAAEIRVDPQWYLAQYPNIAEAIRLGQLGSAEEHYQRSGLYERYLPANPFVDEAWYLQKNPDVVQAIQQGIFENGYDHFVATGYRENRAPSAQGLRWEFGKLPPRKAAAPAAEPEPPAPVIRPSPVLSRLKRAVREPRWLVRRAGSRLLPQALKSNRILRGIARRILG